MVRFKKTKKKSGLMYLLRSFSFFFLVALYFRPTRRVLCVYLFSKRETAEKSIPFLLRLRKGKKKWARLTEGKRDLISLLAEIRGCKREGVKEGRAKSDLMITNRLLVSVFFFSLLLFMLFMDMICWCMYKAIWRSSLQMLRKCGRYPFTRLNFRDSL